jgi:hypothetical protein
VRNCGTVRLVLLGGPILLIHSGLTMVAMVLDPDCAKIVGAHGTAMTSLRAVSGEMPVAVNFPPTRLVSPFQFHRKRIPRSFEVPRENGQYVTMFGIRSRQRLASPIEY